MTPEDGAVSVRTQPVDAVPHWTRRIAQLRSRVIKRTRAVRAPDIDIAAAALEHCDELLRELAGAQMLCESLRAELLTSARAWDHLFDEMPGACLLTDAAGTIVMANRAAGALLNLSAKRLPQRELLLFCEDRDAFATVVAQLSNGESAHPTLTVRPRERKPLSVAVTIKPASSAGPGLWLWFLAPVAQRPLDDDSARSECATDVVAASPLTD